jgi:hypothetical protein
MGSDIHLHIEKKNKEGRWEAFPIDELLLPDDRDYEVFAFLAGVRGYSKWGKIQDRGFPGDSEVNQADLGDHSFTHATLYELIHAPWKKANLEESYFCIFCRYVLPRFVDKGWCVSDDDKKKVRILIGFDS